MIPDTMNNNSIGEVYSMNDDDKITTFLSQYPITSPERDYFSAVLDLLRTLDPPITEATGLALLIMFDFATITLDDGRVIGEPWGIMGSREDNARCIAVLFDSINPDPIWWKASYVHGASDMEIIQAAKDLTRQLPTLPIVKEATSHLV
jgi:hypothetical protein